MTRAFLYANLSCHKIAYFAFLGGYLEKLLNTNQTAIIYNKMLSLAGYS